MPRTIGAMGEYVVDFSVVFIGIKAWLIGKYQMELFLNLLNML